jgi:hypothetical protein
MNNPMALLALSGRQGGGSLKDIMMLQMIQGSGFNAVAPAPAPAAPVVNEGPVVE